MTGGRSNANMVSLDPAKDKPMRRHGEGFIPNLNRDAVENDDTGDNRLKEANK